MGFKDTIHHLQEAIDLPLLVTEELHQVYSVDGFKRKSLPLLLDTFSQFSYRPVLNYRPGPFHGWDIQKAGRLSSHIHATACLPLRLEPINIDANRISKMNEVETHIASLDAAIQLGQNFFNTKLDSLKNKIPDDWRGVCEFIGRLVAMYKDKNIDKWQWYLCTKSGTALNFHLMPDTAIDPSPFLQAKADCRCARVNTVNVYPYTIEIVFHAFTKIERLPFNRRHRVRFEPYAKR